MLQQLIDDLRNAEDVDEILQRVVRAAESEPGVLAAFAACASPSAESARVIVSVADRVDGAPPVAVLPREGMARLTAGELSIRLPADASGLYVAAIPADRDGYWLAAACNDDVEPSARLRELAAVAGLAIDRLTTRQVLEHARRENRSLRARYGFLIRGVSHDLKNPIGAIDGYLQLLEAGVRGALTEPQREWTARIGTALQVMLALINDLLDIARVDSGALPLDPQPLPFAAVVREAVDAARRNVADSVEIRIEEQERVAPVVADLTRGRQVVDRMLAHALRTTENGAVVAVELAPMTARGAQAAVALGVSCGRGGMTPEQRTKCLEGLVRIDAVAGRPGGTGLDLALARRLARAMNGDLTWEEHDTERPRLVFWLPEASRVRA